jgi:hypothetical protein
MKDQILILPFATCVMLETDLAYLLLCILNW